MHFRFDKWPSEYPQDKATNLLKNSQLFETGQSHLGMEDQKISKDGSKTQEVEVQKKMAETDYVRLGPRSQLCDRGVTGVFKKKEAPQA